VGGTRELPQNGAKSDAQTLRESGAKDGSAGLLGGPRSGVAGAERRSVVPGTNYYVRPHKFKLSRTVEEN